MNVHNPRVADLFSFRRAVAWTVAALVAAGALRGAEAAGLDGGGDGGVEFHVGRDGVAPNWLLAGPFDRPSPELEESAARGLFPEPGALASPGQTPRWQWTRADEGVARIPPRSIPSPSPDAASDSVSTSGSVASKVGGRGAVYYYAVTNFIGPPTPSALVIVAAEMPLRLWSGSPQAQDAQADPRNGQYGLALPRPLGGEASALWLRLSPPSPAPFGKTDANASAGAAWTAVCLDYAPPPPGSFGRQDGVRPIVDLRQRWPINDHVRDALREAYAGALRLEASPENIDGAVKVRLRAHIDPVGLPAVAARLVDAGSDLAADDAAVDFSPGSSWNPDWRATLEYSLPAPLPDALRETGMGKLRIAVTRKNDPRPEAPEAPDAADAAGALGADGDAGVERADGAAGFVWTTAEASILSVQRLEERLAVAEEELSAWRSLDYVTRFGPPAPLSPSDADAAPRINEPIDFFRRLWPAPHSVSGPVSGGGENVEVLRAAAELGLALEQAKLSRGGANTSLYFSFSRGPDARRWLAWTKRADNFRRLRANAPAPSTSTATSAPASGEDEVIGEGAYVSDIDGSVQPYRYILPAARPDPERPWPLIVMLHGYVPDYNKEQWVDMLPATARTMARAGAAMLWPFGRGNTDFLSIGEDDVLRAVDEMVARFGLDRRRIYLSGFSMGGSGVWTLLAHHPDRWAAAKIWSGRSDWFYWQSETLARSGLDRGNFPAFKKSLVLADNPYDLTEQLVDIPIRAVHPRDDYVVKPGQTSRILEKLRPPLGRMTADQPERGGHSLFSFQMDDPATWRELLTHRLPDDPPRVQIAAYTPKYGRKHGLAIVAVERWGEVARAGTRREIDPDGGRVTFHVEQCENVRTLMLRWPGSADAARAWRRDGRAPDASRYAVVFSNPADAAAFEEPWPAFFSRAYGSGEADGEESLGFVLHRRGRALPAWLARPDAAEASDGAREAPEARGGVWVKALDLGTNAAVGGGNGCYGPVKEAFNRRFVLVLGTGGAPEEREANRLNLERFRRDWKTFAHAELDYLTDVEWLAALEDLRRGNDAHDAALSDAARLNRARALSAGVVCFGSPKTHAYLAAVANRLPFRFYPDGYGVGDPAATAKADAAGDGVGVGVGSAPRGSRLMEARGESLGFLGLYPRPDWPLPPLSAEASGREGPRPYVVIFDGLYYGERQSFNHKWDMAPDYIVFDPEVLDYDSNNAPRLAGFFDSDWRFDPTLAEAFEAPRIPIPIPIQWGEGAPNLPLPPPGEEVHGEWGE